MGTHLFFFDSNAATDYSPLCEVSTKSFDLDEGTLSSFEVPEGSDDTFDVDVFDGFGIRAGITFGLAF